MGQFRCSKFKWKGIRMATFDLDHILTEVRQNIIDTDLTMEEKLIWFTAGQVAVVRHLKDQYNLQEETKYN